jgi:SlyX protein
MTNFQERLQERTDTLETRLAFQDDTIQQLNDALIAQQASIDLLEAEIRQLIDEFRDGVTEAQNGPVDELPPHY